MLVTILLQNAQQVKEWLIKKNLYDHTHAVKKMKTTMGFPVITLTKTQQTFLKNKFGVRFTTMTTKKIIKETNLRKVLEKSLTKTELEQLKTAYDTIGSIAVVEIDGPLEKKAKLIAKYLLDMQKNIKTVLQKSGAHSGEFRTQKMKYLGGEKTKETIHQENKVRLKLNVETVYFSPRLSTERKRIAELVKKKENILVMFSGCGPYPLVIAKNSPAASIIGIEINPEGHRYAVKNVALNKVPNVSFHNGDVREIVPKLHTTFDRILMPLPKSAEDFLDIALSVAAKGTIIHFYDFLHEKEIPEAAIQKIQKACKQAKKQCEILHHVKCGQHAPRTFRICVDFKIK